MARRTLIINSALAVGIVVVAIIGYSWLHTSSKASATRQTTTVRQGTITSTVSASGNVSSAVNVGISFNGCSGTLTGIDVKAGDVVKVGQVLATVTTTDAQSTLATARAALAQAQASLSDSITSARTSVDNAESAAGLDNDQAYASIETDSKGVYTTRAQANAAYENWLPGWVDNGTSSSNTALQRDFLSLQSSRSKDGQQIDQAQTQLDQAEASTSQGRAAVGTAQTNVAAAKSDLAACTLTSPMAATIISVNGTVGATPGSGAVASSSSGSSGTGSASSSTSSGSGSNSSNSSSSSSSTTGGVSTTSGFITMSDLTKLVMPSTVTESDIAGIQVGQSASVLFAALTDANDPNGTTVAATVSEIDLNSTVSSGVVSYGIAISLTAPPSNLRLGQSGTATITTASKANVLMLTSNAITTVGRLKTVTVEQGTATQIVTVTTGLTGNGETEIDSGLTAGETVVLPSTTSTSTLNLLGGGGTGILGGGR